MRSKIEAGLPASKLATESFEEEAMAGEDRCLPEADKHRPKGHTADIIAKCTCGYDRTSTARGAGALAKPPSARHPAERQAAAYR